MAIHIMGLHYVYCLRFRVGVFLRLTASAFHYVLTSFLLGSAFHIISKFYPNGNRLRRIFPKTLYPFSRGAKLSHYFCSARLPGQKAPLHIGHRRILLIAVLTYGLGPIAAVQGFFLPPPQGSSAENTDLFHIQASFTLFSLSYHTVRLLSTAEAVQAVDLWRKLPYNSPRKTTICTGRFFVWLYPGRRHGPGCLHTDRT